MKKNLRAMARGKRKSRIRKSLSGNAERPRLCVFKSTKHIYAQIIDDTKGHTLVSASSVDKELKGKSKATLAGAKEVGQCLGKRATQKGLKKVVFDRSGFSYHGLLKALAEGARETGLEF